MMSTNSTKENATFTFTWSIENFRFCTHGFKRDFLESPPFVVSSLHKTKWTLQLLPKEKCLWFYLKRITHDSSSTDCLRSYGEPKSVAVRFEISLVSDDGSIFSVGACNSAVFEEGVTLKQPVVLEFSREQKVQLHNDTLIVRCCLRREPAEVDKDLLSLSQDIANIYNSGRFSDMIIYAGEEKFCVHRSVMLARTGMGDPSSLWKELVFKLTDRYDDEYRCILSAPTLKALLWYCYTGQFKVTSQDLYPALSAASETCDLWKIFHPPSRGASAHTRIELKHVSFTWLLENFSALEKEAHVFVPLISEETALHQLSLGIRLMKNCAEGASTQISIQPLRPAVSKKKFIIHSKITVVNALGVADDFVEKYCVYDPDNCTEWNLQCFDVFDKLNANNKLFLPNDTLSLRCEFTVPLEENSRIREIEYESLTELCYFKDNDNLGGLSGDLEYLMEFGAYSDVILWCEEQSFQAHRFILCARSETFSRMFADDPVRYLCGSGSKTLTDIEPDSLRRMLMYMYTATVGEMKYDDAIKLYAAACKYEVIGLRERCSCFLKSNLNLYNFSEVLLTADEHSDGNLVTIVQEFIILTLLNSRV